MWYFAYGSNLNALAVAEWCRLHGHRPITLQGGKPGPTVMIRAEMDALPITEASEVPYRSRNLGIMHACGHDAHSAVAAAVAARLAEARARSVGERGGGLPAGRGESLAAGQGRADRGGDVPGAERGPQPHPADAALHGPADAGGVRAGTVDHVGVVSEEL